MLLGRVAAVSFVLLSVLGTSREALEICVVPNDGPESTRTVSSLEAARLLAETRSYEGPCVLAGPAALLGGVPVQAYVQIGQTATPYAIGIRFPSAAFNSLPTDPADGYRCLDVNDDDRVDIESECVGGHERVLFLPRDWEDEVDAPFKWALFNWNPVGHGPEGVWDVPHFDFHFFVQSLHDRNSIRIGRCAMLVDCDDLELGTTPVPERLLPPGYEDRGVVEFGMGNHLIDPETFGNRTQRPSHSLIYGAWAGKVSFLEPMITLRFLERLASGDASSGCYSLPTAPEVDESGYYPTSYCIRYRANREEYAVSLEDFVLRSASRDEAQTRRAPNAERVSR